MKLRHGHRGGEQPSGSAAPPKGDGKGAKGRGAAKPKRPFWRRLPLGKYLYLGLAAVGVVMGGRWLYWQVTSIEAFGIFDATLFRVQVEQASRIKRLLVAEGDRVQEGQVVAMVTNPDYEDRATRLKVSLAKTAVDRREGVVAQMRQLERDLRLVQRDLRRRRRQLALAEAALQGQRQRLVHRQAEVAQAQRLFGLKAVTVAELRGVEQQLLMAETEVQEFEVRAATERQAITDLEEEARRVEALMGQLSPPKIADPRQKILEEYAERAGGETLRAGAAGIVHRVHKNAGEVAAVRETIMEVVAEDTYMIAFVRPRYVAKLRPGMKAEIRTPAGDWLEGRVTQVRPKATVSLKRFARLDLEKELIPVRLDLIRPISEEVQRSVGVRCEVFLK